MVYHTPRHRNVESEANSEADCNILNFGPTIYRHDPIDHDDYIDILFLGQIPHNI